MKKPSTYFAQTDARNKRVTLESRPRTAQNTSMSLENWNGKSTLLENMAVQDIKNGEA